MKSALYLILLMTLTGCSAGRYYNAEEQKAEVRLHIGQEDDPALIHDITSLCLVNSGQNGFNTVFVHLGLLLFKLNWDQSLAVGSANILIEQGYAGKYLELRDRNASRIGEQMLSDPGLRFIGLHYSMGAEPHYLSASLESVIKARLESDRELTYYPILVDPFNIDQASALIDLDTPALGQVFIILSQDFSLLRPNINGINDAFLSHPKVHLIYAEDIGENWGHFSPLSDVVSKNGPTRSREIFFLIAETIVTGHSPEFFEKQLALLKIKYASEDSRPFNAAWLRLVRDLPCAQKSPRFIAAIAPKAP